MEFNTSQTKDNLMRAFAGESQARNRYTFAAEMAKKQKLQVVEAVFTFTAQQELAHAKVFYDHLQDLSGSTITVDGGYPVDLQYSMAERLRAAQHGEYEEWEKVYPAFAEIAKNEGFPKVAASFFAISKIEKLHGDRFSHFAELMEQNKLFNSEGETEWMCLNCGHIHKGLFVPEKCPVCEHDKGYFIRLSQAPFQG